MGVRAGRVVDGGEDSKIFGVREGFMVTGAGGRRGCLVKWILEASGRVGAIGVVGKVDREEDIIFVELFRGGGRGGKVVGWRHLRVNAEESIG